MPSLFYRRGPTLRQFVLSYAPDWIITIVFWWFSHYIADHVTGFKRHFSLADPSLRYPYAVRQRVSSQLQWFLGGALPLCAQIVLNLLFTRSWWDFHHSALGLCLSIALTGSVTQLVKVTVGRPRPDVIARCQPAAGSEDPHWGLSTAAVCTQTSKGLLEDGWRSFPSGHASLAFAGLGFLTFYLAGKLRLFDTCGRAGKTWLTLVPLGIATWVAITRTMDSRHHWQDVLVGSALGLGVAYFSYRQYYPDLASKTAHVPFKTRFQQTEYDLDTGATTFGDVDDEEERVGLIGGNRKPQGDTEEAR